MSSVKRRSQRKPAESVIQVVNTMTGAMIGRVGNLSGTGLMLISNVPTQTNALYQFQFYLPDEFGMPMPIEVGLAQHWSEQARTPGQYWAGFSFIDISSRDQAVVNDWVAQSQRA